MQFTTEELNTETERLFEQLKKLDWTRDDCALIAPLTLEINTIKNKQNAIILAHSYQTPDIKYGIADFIGDSYGLSVKAAKHPAQKILFCSVHFMAETAKLLSPEKQVVVPKPAGCSLAESITAEDVRRLKAQHPGAPVVCYVNTSAGVKAESDVCCTSSNAIKIIEALNEDKIIFIPDEFMAYNLQKMTNKQIISSKGRCIVHEEFTPETIDAIREAHPGVQILAHPECSPQVIDKVDMAGGTAAMINHIKNSPIDTFMLVTECGLTERINAEVRDKKVVGTCSLCPYMKEILLKDVLHCLKDPNPEQIITLDQETMAKAKASLDKMFALENILKAK